MNNKLTAAQRRLLKEEQVQISDNQISSLKHHIEDCLEGLGDNDDEYIKRGLGDMMEIVDALVARLSKSEKAEI
jgi:hypothetical protein